MSSNNSKKRLEIKSITYKTTYNLTKPGITKFTTDNIRLLTGNLMDLTKNFNNVITKAKEIYNKMNNKQKPFIDVCCNYKLLESIASKYDEKKQKEYDVLIYNIKDKYKDPKDFIKNQNLFTKEKGFEESIKNLIEKYKQSSFSFWKFSI